MFHYFVSDEPQQCESMIARLDLVHCRSEVKILQNDIDACVFNKLKIVFFPLLKLGVES